MIENTNIDRVMKDMLADSCLELSHPDFNRLIMKKILLEKQRKIKRQILMSGILLGIVIEGFTFFMIRTQHPLNINTFNLGFRIHTFVHEILINVDKSGGWFIENTYFILPLIVIIVFKKIIETSLKYL